nr:RNA-dependent RNA polymerase [Flumine sobemo-like virus 4]
MNQFSVMLMICLAALVTVTLDCIQRPDPSNLILFPMMASPILILALLFAWLSWRNLPLEAEPTKSEEWAEILGDPTLDPERGIYATVLIGTKLVKVVLQPKWWHLLPSAIERSAKEAVCDNSVISQVQPGKEPPFLVVLQNEAGETKGMGSRVRMRGKDVLLTSYHVVKSSPSLYIAKYSKNEGAGKRINIDPTWSIDFFCADSDVDMIAVNVPARVWSSLGVGVVEAKCPTQARKPVIVYGAANSSAVKSSLGMGQVTGAFTGVHTATTVRSWSGSPVVSGGQVIGVHRGAHPDEQDKNVFSVLHPSILFNSNESTYDDGFFRELDEEEMAFRHEADYGVTSIPGRGVVQHNSAEWLFNSELEKEMNLRNRLSRKGVILWSDAVDDDDSMVGYTYFDSHESLPDNLNCHRVGSGLSSPPFLTSGTTSSPVPTASVSKECPSLTLESRVSNLESLLEASLLRSSKTDESISMLLKTLTGLNVEVVRNSIPSSSKLPDSALPQHPPTSERQSKPSKPSTPKQVYVAVSKETGNPSPSKRASRRSRKKNSNVTPLPESR